METAPEISLLRARPPLPHPPSTFPPPCQAEASGEVTDHVASRKHDFEITETITGYYRKIDPPDCYVLSFKL